MTKRLGDIAHARAGDKGDTSILMVAPYVDGDYARMCALLSPARVAAHFGTTESKVLIHPSPQLNAVTIALRGQLNGGVTRATTLDPHGKNLSGFLLTLALHETVDL